MADIERRIVDAGLEVRGEDEKRTLVGYAAKFNVRSEDLGGFVESIAPGAFDRAISEGHDVRALWNHNPDVVLGRTKAGTLRLSVDEVGLRIETDLPDTQAARDLRVSVARGDVSQMSFGFRTKGDEWRTEDGVPYRTLTDLDLYDVSPVTYPAYPQTEVSVRALDQARELAAPAPPPAAPVERLARQIVALERDAQEG
jgi:HK97 family phage prohead protease